MRIVLYTADIGHYDETWPPAQQDTTTEFQRLTRADCPIADVSDRLVGRWLKCHPHLLFPDADVTIWIDACLEVISPTFAKDVAGHLNGAAIAMFEHPDRDNVDDEIVAAHPMAKYTHNRHRQMATALSEALFPNPPGLWAMTTVVRRQSAEVTMVDDLVWAETRRWSGPTVALDQVILPFVLAATGTQVAPLRATWQGQLGGNLWQNDWFVRHPHRRDT